MSPKQTLYLDFWRKEYSGSNRAHKGRIIDEVSGTFSWERKHTIKALNGRVTLGKLAAKRGRKAIYGNPEKLVIMKIWEDIDQPGGKRLKNFISLNLADYEVQNGKLEPETRERVLACSARHLDRIIKACRGIEIE